MSFFPRYFSYYFCLAAFAFFLLQAALNGRSIRGVFKDVPARTWLVLFGVFLAGCFLRAFVVPHQHYVFYDEYEHTAIAKVLMGARQFGRCTVYLDGACLAFDGYISWLPGYHFLLSLWFKIFGAGESAAYGFNVMAGSVSVVVAFMAAWLVFRRAFPSLITASLLAILPLHCVFSGNASSEMLSFLFGLLCYLSALIFVELQTKRTLYGLISCAAYLVLIRPENYLYLIPLLALFLARPERKALVSSFFKKAALFLWPPLFYLPQSLKLNLLDEFRGFVSLAPLTLLKHNSMFWIEDLAVPLAVVVLAVAGFLCLLRGRRKEAPFWLPVHFFVFFLFFTFIQRVPLRCYDDQRYNLQFCFPVVCLASWGIFEICRWGERSRKGGGILVFLITALVIGRSVAGAFARIEETFVKQNFKNQDRLLSEMNSLDKNAVFFAYSPSVVIAKTGRSVFHLHYFVHHQDKLAFLRGRRFVLIDDLWCSVEDPEDLCVSVREKCALRGIRIGDGFSELFFDLKQIRDSPPAAM